MYKIDWTKTTIEEDYKITKSILAVAKKYNCVPSSVSLELKRRGIKISHDDKSIETTSGIGRYGELIALELLPGSVDMNEKYNVNAPFDLLWDNKAINVKTSNLRPSFSKGKRFNNMKWNYKIVNPNYKTDERKRCDYYLFLGLDENRELEKAFLVPSDVVGKTVCIGRKSSKLDKYLIITRFENGSSRGRI